MTKKESPKHDEKSKECKFKEISDEERERYVRNWHRFFYKKVYLPLCK